MIRFYMANVIQLFFYIYTMLIFARIIISWLPAWQNHTIVRFITYLTDPFLNFFRKLVPPLGGVLDLSPLLAFFVLRMGEKIILRILL